MHSKDYASWNQDSCTINILSEYGQNNDHTLKTSWKDFVKETKPMCINTNQAKAKALAYCSCSSPLQDHHVCCNPLFQCNRQTFKCEFVQAKKLHNWQKWKIWQDSYSLWPKLHSMPYPWPMVNDVHSILFNSYLTVPNAPCCSHHLMQWVKAELILLVFLGKWDTQSQEQAELHCLMAQLKGVKESILQPTKNSMLLPPVIKCWSGEK